MERPDAIAAERRAGARLQVNASSLAGATAPAERARGLALLRAGQADVIASDAHRATRPPRLGEALAVLDAHGIAGGEALVRDVPRPCSSTGSARSAPRAPPEPPRVGSATLRAPPVRRDAGRASTPYRDGPLLVRGDFELPISDEEAEIPCPRCKTSLCRVRRRRVHRLRLGHARPVQAARAGARRRRGARAPDAAGLRRGRPVSDDAGRG